MTKILFAGTSEIALPLLRALFSHNDMEISAVLTSVDKPRGRTRELKYSPVKEEALKMGIPVLQFESLRTEAREAVRKTGATCLVCFSYGKIFGPMFLSLFKDGAYNIHPSDLPELRGPAPVRFTILKNLKTACISIQSISKETDAGDLWHKDFFPLDGTETSESLTTIIAQRVSVIFPDILNMILKNTIKSTKQVGNITYTSMLKKEDALIDFDNSLSKIHAQIRAFYPELKAETVICGRRVFLTGVYGGFEYVEHPYTVKTGKVGEPVVLSREKGIGFLCGDGNVLFVSSLQLPGKKEMGFKDFLNGNKWLSSIIPIQTI